MTNLKDIILDERNNLRSELHDLKTCQLRYFMLSITATGVLVGLGSGLQNNSKMALLFMAPLVIVLPCWRVFFDKATTITRIVGYLRVVEDILSNDNKVYRYIGWENALQLFRDEEESDGENGKGEMNKDAKIGWWRSQRSRAIRFMRQNILEIDDKEIENSKMKLREYTLRIIQAPFRNIFRLIKIRTRKRYWLINWYTFLLLSSLCLILSIYVPSGKMDQVSLIFAIISFTFIVRNAIRTSGILVDLLSGSHSYDCNFQKWKRFLIDERFLSDKVSESGKKLWFVKTREKKVGPCETLDEAQRQFAQIMAEYKPTMKESRRKNDKITVTDT